MTADKPYQKHHVAVCGGDAALGMFLYRLTRFLAGTPKGARFFDNFGVERLGIAQTWDKWAEELGLTRKQLRRVLEKAEDLGFIVRAQRLYVWGKRQQFQANRLHVAVTDTYEKELKRCVALTPREYRRLPAKGNLRAHSVCPDGHTAGAQKGTTTLPTVGNPLKDYSSPTLLETLKKRDCDPAGAGDTQSPPQAGEEREEHEHESPSPKTEKAFPLPPVPLAPLPAEYQIDFGTAPVTTRSADLAAKFSIPVRTVSPDDLRATFAGSQILMEWIAALAEYGLPPPGENVTDEQIAALDWWCEWKRDSYLVWSRPYAMTGLIDGWSRIAPAFVACDDWTGMPEAPEKPCLEFVRQLVDALRPAKEKAWNDLAEAATLLG